MRYLLIASVLITSTSTTAAPPKRKPKVAEPAVCTSLAADYENASKKLSALKAEGLLDDSAPRATMRETQSNNILNQARITMDLMKNNGCKAPTAAPSEDRFMLDALKCHTALLKQQTDALRAINSGQSVPELENPAECDQTHWTAE